MNDINKFTKSEMVPLNIGRREIIQVSLGKEKTIFDDEYKIIDTKRFEIPLFEITRFPDKDTLTLQIENMKAELRNDLSIFNKLIQPIGKQSFFVITNKLFLNRIEKISKNLEITDEESFLAKIVEYSLEEKFRDSLNYSLKFLINDNKINQTKLFNFFPKLLERKETND